MSYWDDRAQQYNNLDWVTNEKSVSDLLSFVDLKENETFVDLGCGSGKITRYFQQYSKSVIGIDSSKEMIRLARESFPTVPFFIADLIEFTGMFDKALLRMVCHHFTDEKQRNDCIKQLSQFISNLFVVEAIPPIGCLSFFKDVFSLKEERICLEEKEWIDLFEKNGWILKKRQLCRFKMNIDNWLNSDVSLSVEKRKQIKHLHIAAPDFVKQAYNMQEEKEGITLNTTHLMMSFQSGEMLR